MDTCEHTWEYTQEIKMPLLRKCARCGQTYVVKGIKEITWVVECGTEGIPDQTNQVIGKWQLDVEYSCWIFDQIGKG